MPFPIAPSATWDAGGLHHEIDSDGGSLGTTKRGSALRKQVEVGGLVQPTRPVRGAKWALGLSNGLSKAPGGGRRRYAFVTHPVLTRSMQTRSSISRRGWRRRLATFVVAATAATSVAVVPPIGSTPMAVAEDPPPALPDGWQGTVSVTHMAKGGTTTITATFDPTGFRRSRSWAEAFPLRDDFVAQAGTSRMWQQDYSVDCSFVGWRGTTRDPTATSAPRGPRWFCSST